MRRYAAAVLVAGLSVSSALGFTRSATGSGATPIQLFWGNLLIAYRINDQTSDSLPNIVAGSDPQVAVHRSLRAWQDEGTIPFNFFFAGTTATTNAGNDGLNLITFADTATAFNGALGIAKFFFNPVSGQITESDITFNPAITFSTKGSAAGVYDIQQVGTHEAGHFLGLAHSGILSATMYPFTRDDRQIERFLDFDDLAAIREVYAPGGGGKISGTITRSGSAVFGAHVVAVDSNGRPRVSALSLKDGTYALPDLAPDTYNVVVEPMDGPVTQANFSNWWQSAIFGGSYQTTFFGGNVSPTDVVVGSGQTVPGIDVAVIASAPTVNPTLSGKAPTSGGDFVVETTLTTVLQGDTNTWDIVVAGDGLGSPAGFEIFGPGVARVGGFTYGTLGGTIPFARARFDFAADAFASPRLVKVTSGSEVAVFTANVEILPFPSRLELVPDPFDSNGIFLTWYGGEPPFALERDTQVDFTTPILLLLETDTQFSDPVLNDTIDYFYRVDE